MKGKGFLSALFAVIILVCFSSCPDNPWWPSKVSSSPSGGSGFYNPSSPSSPPDSRSSTGDLKVTYLPNGADSGTVPTDANGYLKGDPVTVKTAPVPLARAGYEFAEWSDEHNYDDAGESYSTGGQFTIDTHKNLYAVWLEEDKVIKLNQEKKYTFPPKEVGYDPLAPVKVTVLNITSGTTDQLTISIGGQDPNKDYFDIFYDTGSGPGSSMNHNDIIDPIDGHGTFSFWVVPKHGLAVGNYSITVRISNNPADFTNASQRCTFIAGFVVTPHSLIMKASELVYTNPNGRYITPIVSDTSAAPAYTERTAAFTVEVRGFKTDADAAGTVLTFSDAASGGAIDYLDFVQTLNPLRVIDPVTGLLIKTFTVTVTFMDTAIAAGKDPLDEIFIETSGVSSDYFKFANAKAGIVIKDGQVSDKPVRLVPVNHANVAAFNAYANTNGLAANGQEYSGLARHYIQAQNIALAAPAPGESNWKAIGNSTDRFSGSYDGDNKTISGINIYNPTVGNQGMFGVIDSGGTVKKLKLENANITGEQNVGGVAGWNSGGTVDACEVVNTTVSGKHLLYSHVGGIVGSNAGTVKYSHSRSGTVVEGFSIVGGVVGKSTGQVLGCTSTYDVTAGTSVGGVVGANEGTGTVKDCWASGRVTSNTTTGTTSNAGGVVGYNDYEVLNSHYKGSLVSGTGANVGGVVGNNRNPASEVSGSTSTGAVTGPYRVGGIVGYSIGKVTDCSSTGIVTGSGSVTISGTPYTGATVGGVVGGNEGGTVTGSHSTGRVSGGSFVGGVAGSNSGASALVENCYATGTVTGNGNIGGVVGRNEGGTVETSHATGSVTNTGTAANVGGVLGANVGAASKVQTSYAIGTVTSSGSYVGGIVGVNQGTLEKSYATGAVSGAGYVGGVVGSSNGTVQTSYATGAVTGNGTGNYVGGVAALNQGTLENSYATGNVTGSGERIGGVVGSNTGTVQNSYATGIVSGGSRYVGGVVGINNDATAKLLNSVALSPSVTGASDVGRVIGEGSTLANNYARSTGMTVSGGTVSNKTHDGIDGEDITAAAQWNSAAWWTGTALFDPAVWNIVDGSLPRLRNMPGNPAQNPAVQ